MSVTLTLKTKVISGLLKLLSNKYLALILTLKTMCFKFKEFEINNLKVKILNSNFSLGQIK